MAGRQHSGCDLGLDNDRKPQKPQRVGDLRPRAAKLVRQFLLCGAKVFQHLLVGGGFFQWVQVCSVQVLQKSIPQHVFVRGVSDNRWNLGKTGFNAGA